jgi:hypothetical protein
VCLRTVCCANVSVGISSTHMRLISCASMQVRVHMCLPMSVHACVRLSVHVCVCVGLCWGAGGDWVCVCVAYDLVLCECPRAHLCCWPCPLPLFFVVRNSQCAAYQVQHLRISLQERKVNGRTHPDKDASIEFCPPGLPSSLYSPVASPLSGGVTACA